MIAAIRPRPRFPWANCLVPPLPCGPRPGADSALCPVSKRGTLAKRPAGSVRPRDGCSQTADRERLDAATAALDPPFAVVDLDAFDANAADLLRRAGGKPVRLASKSVRCRALTERALGAGLQGILAFTLPEALWLAGHGLDDLVVAYPTADRAALRELAAGAARERVTVMVDCARAPRRDRGGRRGAGGAGARLPRRRRRLVAARRAA